MKYLGLTKERYEQLLEVCDGDRNIVAELVDNWGVETCNKGYGIFDVNSTGLLEIEPILELEVFETHDDAVEQAIKDGVKIIPIEELPKNFEWRYLAWIDTEENRKAIKKYCKYHRYIAIKGFNTKQWWAYDEKTDEYCDIPLEVLKQVENYSKEEYLQKEYLNRILNEEPKWLNDEEYRYNAENIDI